MAICVIDTDVWSYLYKGRDEAKQQNEDQFCAEAGRCGLFKPSSLGLLSELKSESRAENSHLYRTANGSERDKDAAESKLAIFSWTNER